MAERLTLPDQNVPVVDPRTGKISEHWYQRLQQLVAALNSLLP